MEKITESSEIFEGGSYIICTCPYNSFLPKLEDMFEVDQERVDSKKEKSNGQRATLESTRKNLKQNVLLCEFKWYVLLTE